MIVSCPTCATRHDVPPGAPAFACRACGGVIVAEASGFDAAAAAARLAEAAFLAEAGRLRRAARRRRGLMAWGAFTVITLAPLAAALSLPGLMLEILPQSASLYHRLGYAGASSGLEIRAVTPQRKQAEAGEILGVTGQIGNAGSAARKIPPIRFALLDGSGREVFSWFLPETAKALKPGDATGFVTRIADPPQTAQSLEIRFARAGEISSNAAP